MEKLVDKDVLRAIKMQDDSIDYLRALLFCENFKWIGRIFGIERSMEEEFKDDLNRIITSHFNIKYEKLSGEDAIENGTECVRSIAKHLFKSGFYSSVHDGTSDGIVNSISISDNKDNETLKLKCDIICQFSFPRTDYKSILELKETEKFKKNINTDLKTTTEVSLSRLAEKFLAEVGKEKEIELISGLAKIIDRYAPDNIVGHVVSSCEDTLCLVLGEIQQPWGTAERPRETFAIDLLCLALNKVMFVKFIAYALLKFSEQKNDIVSAMNGADKFLTRNAKGIPVVYLDNFILSSVNKKLSSGGVGTYIKDLGDHRADEFKRHLIERAIAYFSSEKFKEKISSEIESVAKNLKKEYEDVARTIRTDTNPTTASGSGYGFGEFITPDRFVNATNDLSFLSRLSHGARGTWSIDRE